MFTDLDTQKILGSTNEPYFYRFIFRPIAYLLTENIFKGISANSITYFRFFLCLIFFLVFIGDEIFYLIALSIYIFNCILDCVDGNIARLTNSASFWGKFIDGYIDCLLEIFILLFGIIYLYLNNDLNTFKLCLIIIAIVLFLIENYTRDRISFYREWIKNSTSSFFELGGLVKESGFFIRNKSTYMNKLFIDIKLILICLCLCFISISTYLLLLSFLSIFVSSFRVITDIQSAYKNINIHRTSAYKK